VGRTIKVTVNYNSVKWVTVASGFMMSGSRTPALLLFAYLELWLQWSLLLGCVLYKTLYSINSARAIHWKVGRRIYYRSSGQLPASRYGGKDYFPGKRTHGFIVERVTSGKAFLRILRFSPEYITKPTLHAYSFI